MAVTDAFVAGLTRSGRYCAETLHVSSLHVTPCTGCLSCWGRTEGECVIHNDDVPTVKKKIMEADIIIESFPLYFFGLPGQLKLLTDRLLPMVNTYHGQLVPKDGAAAHGLRQYRAGQKLILISSCAFAEIDEVYDPLLRQFDLICGRGSYTAIFCPQLHTAVHNGGTRMERIKASFIAAGEEFDHSGHLSEETLRRLSRPPFSHGVYETILDGVWKAEREMGEVHDTTCN